MDFTWIAISTVILLISLAGIALYVRQKSLLFKNKEVLPEIESDYQTGFEHVGEHEIFFQHYINRQKQSFVLIHGIGASCFSWRFLPALLKTIGNVIILDLPGFGESSKNPDYSHGINDQARVVHKFLQQRKVDDPILVGSSMGGTISLWMAHLYPGIYKKLILISPAIAPFRARLVHIPSVFTFAKVLGDKFISKKLIENFVRKTVLRQKIITEEVIDNYYEPYRKDRNAMLCFVKATNIFKEVDMWKDLDNLSANVLLTWGKEDQVTPFRHVRRFKRVFPQWTYKFHPYAGHHIQEDDPEWLVKKIETWMSH